ncbi:MAG TPA: ABC transporter substrate-binding protein [Pseudonocardia sp.]|nr:ABC transporter substrate-binding protein [Pseudonocardia sp.]
MPVLTPPRPLQNALDRRDLLTGAAALGVLAGLAGCGAAPEPAPAGVPTRRIEGAFGPVDVPADPRRVVSTDWYTPWALLDVGVTVIGTPEANTGGVLPAYQPVYEAMTKIGTTTQLDFEAIVALEPDLILGTLVPNLPADVNDRLSAITPTLLFEAAREPGTWQERAVRAADAVGRRAEGEAVRAAYEQRAADLRSRYAEVLGRTRWALVRGGQQGNALVDLPASWSGVVLERVGARFGRVADGKPGVFEALSFEQLGLLDDCDVILHLADTSGNVNAETQRVLDQPTFRALPAARAGHVYPLPNYYVSHYRQADAVLTELEAVLGRLAQ